MVEGEQFKELVRYLEPVYVFPLRATVTECIEKNFEEMDEQKVKLALTTDCWTALTNKNLFNSTDWEPGSVI